MRRLFTGSLGAVRLTGLTLALGLLAEISLGMLTVRHLECMDTGHDSNLDADGAVFGVGPGKWVLDAAVPLCDANSMV